MRQRWYDASLRRFLNRDPLRSVNRYVYGANRPNLVDPMGLDASRWSVPRLRAGE